MSRDHLRIVQPLKQFPFECVSVAFAKIGPDNFICIDGEWHLMEGSAEAAAFLLKWIVPVSSGLSRRPENDDAPLPWPPKGAA